MPSIDSPQSDARYTERWNARYDAFYEAYYEEILAGEVIDRWQKLDLAINLLVALTASGSTFSGLALWNTPGGKPIWGLLASVASLGSIFHSIARVATDLQQQGEARRDFSLIRGNLQNVLYKMRTAGDSDQLETQFEALRAKFVELSAKLEPDIAATLFLRKKAQSELNGLLQRLGIIKIREVHR
jgi:hypothetical protein